MQIPGEELSRPEHQMSGRPLLDQIVAERRARESHDFQFIGFCASVGVLGMELFMRKYLGVSSVEGFSPAILGALPGACVGAMILGPVED